MQPLLEPNLLIKSLVWGSKPDKFLYTWHLNSVENLSMLLTWQITLNQILQNSPERGIGDKSICCPKTSMWLGQGREEEKLAIATHTEDLHKPSRSDFMKWTQSLPGKTFLDDPFVVKIIWGYSILGGVEGICWHMAPTNYKHPPNLFCRKTHCQLKNVWLIIVWDMLLWQFDTHHSNTFYFWTVM